MPREAAPADTKTDNSEGDNGRQDEETASLTSEANGRPRFYLDLRLIFVSHDDSETEIGVEEGIFFSPVRH